ncbi:hypothetical protein BDAP_001970 [Binucleata daphniae]
MNSCNQNNNHSNYKQKNIKQNSNIEHYQHISMQKSINMQQNGNMLQNGNMQQNGHIQQSNKKQQRDNAQYNNNAEQINKQVIDELKNMYYKNRSKFETQQYKMNIDEIKLNNIMLDFEEKVFFDKEIVNYEERREKRFMQMFTCCNKKFDTFAEFAKHKDIIHEEEMQEENCEVVNPEYKYVPIKIIADDITSSGEGDKYKQHRCVVEGCYKTYTSAYGLKYHTEKGHAQEVKEAKPHKCTIDNCTKRYKNVNGLKYHLEHAHKT